MPRSNDWLNVNECLATWFLFSNTISNQEKCWLLGLIADLHSGAGDIQDEPESYSRPLHSCWKDSGTNSKGLSLTKDGKILVSIKIKLKWIKTPWLYNTIKNKFIMSEYDRNLICHLCKWVNKRKEWRFILAFLCEW